MSGDSELQARAGTVRALLFAYAAAISVFHLWANTVGALPTLWLNALHLGMMGSLGCWLVALRSPLPWRAGWQLLGLCFVIGGVYLPLAEESLRQRGEVMIAADLAVAGVVTVGVLVLCGRRSGWTAPLLAILAFGYVVFLGRYLDGVFHFRGLGLPRVLYRYYFTGEGLFGLPTTIAASYVYMFLLFSAFLLRSGAGEVISRLAGVLARRFPGGAGYAAVVASGVTGTISGSAIANTVSTGAVTIPLMKRSGFSPTQAAAIETAASTGGQLMPPIMGAGAFLMAQYSGIPYVTIISAAAIPALLYFCGVGFFVYFLCRGPSGAGRLATAASDDDKQEPPLEARKLYLPILGITVLLLAGLTPVFAAAGGIAIIVVLSWFSPSGRMGVRAILEALVQGAQWMVTTSLLLACTGIVVGTLTMTGLSTAVSHLILSWSGGVLPIALILLALLSLVAGMGLPVTAAYIVLAVVAVPALQDLGVSLLAAHFIVFWLSQDSNVTPPVCLAAFTAAGMAGSPPMRTGLMAWKAAKALYIVVILFAYTNLLDGSWSERIWVGGFALAGLFALTAALAPQDGRGNPILRRTAWLLTTVCLLVPIGWLNIVGIVALAAIAGCRSDSFVRFPA